jgi:hypothetical protein
MGLKFFARQYAPNRRLINEDFSAWLGARPRDSGVRKRTLATCGLHLSSLLSVD